MIGRRLIWVVSGVLFLALTVWVHREVKGRMAADIAAEIGGAVEQAGNLTVGEEIPDFAATDLDGESVALADFRGREVVVLDFWATWCMPCIRSMPSLESLNDEFAGRGAAFLAVNVGEEPEPVHEFVKTMDFGVRVVMDEDEDIASAYGLPALPQLVIVGKDGRVEHIERGYPWLPQPVAQRNRRLRAKLEDLIGMSEWAAPDAPQ